MDLWYENDAVSRWEIKKALGSEKMYDMFH